MYVVSYLAMEAYLVTYGTFLSETAQSPTFPIHYVEE